MAMVSGPEVGGTGLAAVPQVFLWKLRSDGSFLSANLATGVAHYSYPSSVNAEAARKRPREVALASSANDAESLAILGSSLRIASDLARRNEEWIRELKAAPFYLEAAGRSLTFPSYNSYQAALDWIAKHDLDDISDYCEGHGYGLHVPGTQELQSDWVTIAAYVRAIHPAAEPDVDRDFDIENALQPR